MTGHDPPTVPTDANQADRPALEKALYDERLAAAAREHAATIARQDAATALATTREDTAQAVHDRRSDVEEALRASREDKTTEHERAVALAELGHENARDIARQSQNQAIALKEFEHRLTAAETRIAVRDARVDADLAAETALVQSVHDAYLRVCEASLDRSLKRAEFLTATIGTISTAYTGLLALVYGIGDKQTPLAARALIPVLFLGAALVFAAFYAAFLRRKVVRRDLLPTGVGGTLAQDRLRTFNAWTFAGVLERAWALRTSLVCFGIGVALLPIPFVDVSDSESFVIGAAGAAVAVVWGLVEHLNHRKATRAAEAKSPEAAPRPEPRAPLSGDPSGS
jgi:hypothetical protein